MLRIKRSVFAVFSAVLLIFCGCAENTSEKTAFPEKAAMLSEESGIDNPAPAKVSVTVSAAGDCTLGTNQHHTDTKGAFNDIYSKKGDAYFLSNVKELFESDDFTIVNLEGTLTNNKKPQTTYYHYRLGRLVTDKRYLHRGKPEYIDILKKGGVDGVSFANNHNMDYGKTGFDETVKTVEDAGLVLACDEKTCVYTVKGIKIGVVAANEVYDGTERVKNILKNGITALKEEDCDIIIACIHWGDWNDEKTHIVNSVQREIGRFCIDLGADMVIGNHPHVVQEAEKYKGKYIYYALGDFCYGGASKPKSTDRTECIIVRQTFNFTDGERAEDSEPEIIPCKTDDGKGAYTYRPTPAKGADYKKIMKYMKIK